MGLEWFYCANCLVFCARKGFLFRRKQYFLARIIIFSGKMNTFARDFLSTFVCGFVFLLLFFSNPAFAYSSESLGQNQTALFADSDYQLGSGVQPAINSTNSNSLNSGSNTNASENSSNQNNSLVSMNTPNSCIVNRLSPKEARDIMDLTHNGFNGKTIGDTNKVDDNASKKDVKDLGPVKLVGESNDKNTAVTVNAPQYAAPADKFSFFNGKRFNGPFGIGLILDDTLRVGKCIGLQSADPNCKVSGTGQGLRTDGVGVKSDLINAFESVKGTTKTIAEAALSKTDYNSLKSNYMVDLNSKDFTTASFPVGQNLKNTIMVKEYTAKNSTTCNNSACTISTYSAFDKYYNAWLTTDMVVFTVGPTLLHKANKLLTKMMKSTASDDLQKKGWISFLPRMQEKLQGTPAYLMKKIAMPASTTLGKARITRFKALVQEEGFEPLLQKLYVGLKLFSTGAGGEIGEILKPGSEIWKFTPEKRKKLFEAIEHLQAYARENVQLIELAKAEYATAKGVASALADPLAKQAALDGAKIEFGKKMSLHLDDWDEILALDFEKWLKDKEELFSMGGTAFRKNGFNVDNQGYIDVATVPPFNLKRIVQNFRDNGSWANWAGSGDAETFKTAADGVSLQLYKIKPNKLVAENVGFEDLKYHVAHVGSGTYSVKLPTGEYIPLNEASIDYIQSSRITPGAVSIFDSSYAPIDTPMTPLEFANRITDKRIVGRPNTALRNITDFHNALVQNDYSLRTYYSLLDQQFAKEGDMLKTYFKNPAMGIYKGSVLPIAYWAGKKGFGNEDYSAFMLPDTWSTITVFQGVDKLYNDSFIDFFAGNRGSDQGDMFKRIMNSVPFVWNKIIELAAESNQFTKDMLSKVTGGYIFSDGGFLGNTVRDTVGDLAVYTHNENCSDCSGTFTGENNYLGLGFRAGSNMQAFLLEAADEETKNKTGSVIISYTHHSDLKGKTGQIDGEKIDLIKGARDQETCDAKLRKWHLGWASTSVGGLLGVAENMAYMAGFGPGLIASFIQQMTIARDLQDCVDDKEGYYIHFFVPPTKEANKTKSKEVVSNENVTTALSDMSTKLNDFVKDKQSSIKTKDSNTPIGASLDKMKEQFDQFTNKATKANLLQAKLDINPPETGNVTGKDVFYIWFKESLMPSSYNTTGRAVISDGNQSVEINKETGQLKINGKVVLDKNKADFTRLTTPDNRIPAAVVPMTISKLTVQPSDALLFEMNTYGEIRVLDSHVLNCIRRAIYEQVGIQYSGDELTQVFGELQGLETSLYSNVYARGGQIMLEGSGPRYWGTGNSKFVVNGYWNSKLIIDANQGINSGQFRGMTFANGTIVLNTQTNELIIWLRQHKDSILTNKDVKNMNAKLTTIKDPVTECDNSAINLEAVPYQNDELGTQKTNNFNTSMTKLGPFTQFTTDKRIYEFYTKRDANTGDCKQYFRVRDKATGKILTDQEVVGGITQAADGTIKFKTKDENGNLHDQSLLFNAENGVPKLSYNGGPAETLVNAQGPNGSFWYDTEKGLWYPENGLQIPLNQAFKDNGAWFGTDKNGNVIGTPENKMTFNIGSQNQGGISVPSLPETTAGIIAFISLFLILSYITTQGRRPKKKK
jgi:hypothetical protein